MVERGTLESSDADGDGLLNITKFNYFLHPADSKNPKLLQWLCKEEVRERDSDKDRKVSFKRFFHGLFYLVRSYEEENLHSSRSDDSAEAPAKILFSQLDKDDASQISKCYPLSGNLIHQNDIMQNSRQTMSRRRQIAIKMDV